MKTTISYFIFLLLITGVNAQESKTTSSNTSDTLHHIENIDDNTGTLLNTSINNDAIKDDTCYAELSKITFYKALIQRNGFNIEVEDTQEDHIALKSTEEIIVNNRERVSYSE